MEYRNNIAALTLLAAFTVACNDEAPLTTGPADQAPAVTEGEATSHPMNERAPAIASLAAIGGVISNGMVRLGVGDLGFLNEQGFGLMYLPTGNEAIWVGCLCEGWGVADALSGTQAWASHPTWFGAFGMALNSFVSDGTNATSVVTAGGMFEVTHDFIPSAATPNLYEINVTIENTSGVPVDLRYTRDMDWDVNPTPFNEYVTIQGAVSDPEILYSDNNGFQTPGPLFARGSLGATGDFVDFGPQDHGALFDFGFGILPPGATERFTIFYGAARDEASALAAIAAVNATAYSLGQPTSSPPDVGAPNTFIFAYRHFIEVDVDIKPGSWPNSINTKNKGVIPVAILGTQDFDVADVDVTTLAFGPGGAAPVHDPAGHYEDVNGDGLTDLVSHYATQETGLQVGHTEACVTGETLDGIPIEGCDAVRIVK